MKIFGLAVSLLLAVLAPLSAQQSASSPPRRYGFAPIDRSELPPALRETSLDRLSSGALMLLDRDGNLVQPAASRSPKAANESLAAETAAITLDLRVGPNIRLGEDPPALPESMRAQAEPHIARSQSNPDLLVATFQEGRFTNGGAVDCGYSVSHDGGLTWSRALIPALTQAVGGPYLRATDPVAAVALDGKIYLNTEGARDPAFNTGDVVVSRSIDGGQTFEPPRVAYHPPTDNTFPDKNWIAVNTFPDTASAGRVVVTTTLFVGKVTPIARVFSDDDGVTWSAPALINPSNSNTQGSQPVFLPNGNLAVVYWNFGTSTSQGERIEVVVSTNGGITFGAPRLITGVFRYEEPDIRTGVFLPSAAGDRTTNNLYVVYQALNGGAPRILFTKSTNGGTTWSFPRSISDNPAGSGVFNPAISASPDGQRLTAVFYDHRDNPGSTTLVDMYMAQSFDGGATWQPNIRLTSVSTDASRAPLTGSGYMLGDYLGVAESTNENVPAVPVWVDTRTGSPDPFVTRVGIAPQADFTSWQAARLSLGQIENPQLGGPSGDADADREDNLSEFKSVTDPNDPNSVLHSARQLNISTRLPVQTGDDVLIGGFIITGTEPKKVIIRGLGPSLGGAGVPNALANPTLDLVQGSTTIASNDDWRETQQSDVERSTIPPPSDLESAIVRTLDPGAYTTVLRGKDGATGTGLVEVYDLAANANSKLANLSTRGFVQTDDNVMIGGLIIGGGLGANGNGSARVIMRALGPSLSNAGVASPLQDPTLELHSANGAVIASNDNWRQTQQAEIQNSGLAPNDGREAALVDTLPQGSYTAVVRGANNTTGTALIEVYNVP